MKNAGEEKNEPSDAISGNVNWCCHYGEQYGDSLKNGKKELPFDQQSHSWTYIQRNL